MVLAGVALVFHNLKDVKQESGIQILVISFSLVRLFTTGGATEKKKKKSKIFLANSLNQRIQREKKSSALMFQE